MKGELILKSFSMYVKEELSQLSNLNKKNLVNAELQGYLLTTSSNSFSTQSEYNINRFSKLLTNVGEYNFNIQIKGDTYTITTKKKVKENSEKANLEEFVNSEDEIKSLVRGAFLGTGTITDPKINYHLEMIFDKKENAEIIKNYLNQFDIQSNIIFRNKKYVVYIENGESISNFLAFIGANQSMLKFEELRVLKDVRNNINRKVNCETANINKITNSAVKQIDDIKLLKSKHKFNELSDKQKEIANLRLKNPELSLQELGKKAKPQISKSGVNHRLQEIHIKAEELRK